MLLVHVQEEALGHDLTGTCKKELLKLFAACLCYDAGRCTLFLESQRSLAPLLDAITSCVSWTEGGAVVDTFVTVRDQKTCAMGLLAAIGVSKDAMPPTLKAGLGKVLGAVVGLLKSVEALREEGAKMEQEGRGVSLSAKGGAGESAHVHQCVNGVLKGEIQDDSDSREDGEDMEVMLKRLAQAREEDGGWADFLE